MRETSLALYFEDHMFDPASGRYHEPVTPVVEIYVVVPAQTGFFVLRDKASLDAVKGPGRDSYEDCGSF